MAQFTRNYAVIQRSNFNNDLPQLDVPANVSSVNFIRVQVDSKNAGVVTFDTPDKKLQIICYKLPPGASEWVELARMEAEGGYIPDKTGVLTDPALQYQCNPPLVPGTSFKMHVAQTGTFFLGGQLIADYTP